MKEQNALSWYYGRLRSMDLAEIPHRFTEAMLRRVSKTSWLRQRDLRVPRVVQNRPLPKLPLQAVPVAAELSPGERERLQRDTDELRAENVRLLQQCWPNGEATNWALDPESGKCWSTEKYTHDIRRRTGQGPGDVKFVWELSRLQHLQALAYGAAALDDRDAAKSCLHQIESWIDAHPPYVGVGYASGIENACRVVSVLVVATYLSQHVTDSLRRKIWTLLFVHGRFINRFPSLFSSANNHLIAEAAALFVLGCVLPQELAEADRWRTIGWGHLVREAGRQVHADGAGAEQSSSYLASTLEWFLLCRVVAAKRTDFDLGPIDTALRRGAAFLSGLGDTAGNVPRFGDADEGVVLRPAMHDSNYIGSIVATIAAVFDAPEIQHPSFRGDLRTRMLTPLIGRIGEFELSCRMYPDGGYTVLRSGGGERELMAVMDHGPLGFASTAAHGHADALSIWLHAGGRPVLVDFGTYRYAADDGWRAWARSTAAHNTIEVDGESQSSMSGPFNWGDRAQTRVVDSPDTAALHSVTGEHDGYLKRSGVRHRRQLNQLENGHIEVQDDLIGSGIHHVCASFHFASDVTVIRGQDAAQFLIQSGPEKIATMQILAPADLDVCLIRQDEPLKPGAGAISNAYNELASSTSLIVAGHAKLPLQLHSTFALCS